MLTLRPTWNSSTIECATNVCRSGSSVRTVHELLTVCVSWRPNTVEKLCAECVARAVTYSVMKSQFRFQRCHPVRDHLSY